MNELPENHVVCEYQTEPEPIGSNVSWGIWKTSCGKRNLHKCGRWVFCPYCGRKIVLVENIL